MVKCCGTCRLWEAPDGYEQMVHGQCTWPEPAHLPFWVSIYRGEDHEDATAADDGKYCRAWETTLCAP